MGWDIYKMRYIWDELRTEYDINAMDIYGVKYI